MFNLNNFLAMLMKNGYTKEKLANELDISMTSLYRRLNNSGNFTSEEVRIMISLFGKEDVFNSLYF